MLVGAQLVLIRQFNKNTSEIDFKGVRLGKNGQNYQISVFCSKSVFRYGGITSQIFRGMYGTRTPPPKKNEGKGGGSFFFSLKYFNDSKTVF